jgi:hypothetical protein
MSLTYAIYCLLMQGATSEVGGCLPFRSTWVYPQVEYYTIMVFCRGQNEFLYTIGINIKIERDRKRRWVSVPFDL